MDAHPWTYQVMAKEMAREGKIEAVANPDTQAMSDQRNYLYTDVKKQTSYPVAPRSGSFAGVALAAKVGDKWYTSHHGSASISIERDDPAATTIELPAGTTARDITALKAMSVKNGTVGDYSIDVLAIRRGFLLDADYLPTPSFLTWSGKETLTQARTEALLWSRTSAAGAAGGTVPATLSLTMGAAASFGSFTPGVDKTYTASTIADVTSTAGDAALSVSGVGGDGFLTNGTFALAEPLQVAFSKSAWTGPVSHDSVAVNFSQHIGASDALRTGSYAKTLTFTVSTTTP
jgi:hypothetical protein